MERQFGKALIDAPTLANRVTQLGRQISDDYAGRNILLIGVLKGAALFYADLVRAIQVPVILDFVQAKSYVGQTSQAGDIRMLSEPEYIDRMAGRDVIIVEDIVDSGVTIQYLRKRILDKEPQSLALCTLLDKPRRRRIRVPLDYVGFTIPNVFVVGYGMDHDERYRNLPYIAALESLGGE